MVNSPKLMDLKKYQWSSFFSMFYIEPIAFALLFCSSLTATIMKNEIIHRSCSTIFQFNDTDCLQLGKNNVSGYLQEIETKIQPYVANLFMTRTLLESIVPGICGLFIGSWSDHYGRKPLLLVSLTGFSLTYATAAIICKISQYYPVNPWYYILAAIPHSVLGGNCVFYVAAFCFISDVTDIKSRPYRMISLEAFLLIGVMAGSLLSSFIYAATSATFTFLLSAVLTSLTTVYIAIYVPESLNFRAKATQSPAVNLSCNEISFNCDPQENTFSMDPYHVDHQAKNTDYEKTQSEENSSSRKGNKPDENLVKIEKTCGIFNYRHIKDMWITCFTSRPHYDRSIILLVTGTMFLFNFIFVGAITVFYLFVREKFLWTIRDYSFYETLNCVTSVLGLMGFLIMRRVFNLSIVTLALIAVLCSFIRCVIEGLATEAWHLYVAISFGALESVGIPMCRTIISNIVPGTDLGKIFSIKNILQSVAPFVAAPLYTFIYNASLASFPGLFNIISAIFYIIALIFLLFVLRLKLTNKEIYGQLLK